MGAIFLAPLRLAASALTGDANPSAPLGNLLINHLGMVWQSSAPSPSMSVAVAGSPIDSVALWGSNLTPSDTVRVRFGPNASGAGAIYDRTFPGAANFMAFLPDTIMAAYLRLDFSRSMEAARLIVGKKVECDGVAAGAEQTYDDESVKTSGPGWMIGDEYSRTQSWRVTVEFITEDEFFDGWDAFLKVVGQTQPFLFLPYYPTSYAAKLACLGAMTNAPRITWKTNVDRNIEMAFQSLSAAT